MRISDVISDVCSSDLHPTLLADDTAVLEALVLTAQALVVLYRTKDLGAEQTVALRLERTVVDGFRLLYFTEGPGTDHLGRSQGNLDGIELFDLTLVFQQIQQVFQGLSSSRTCDTRPVPGAAQGIGRAPCRERVGKYV